MLATKVSLPYFCQCFREEIAADLLHRVQWELKLWFLLFGQRRWRLLGSSWNLGQAGLPYVPVLANLVP